ncbi:MAG TPA: hypothetical protein VFC44_13270 [Candidatus Saccharimonadales bacterium]|nr:hypothetical protein [Candidatus Saccharimonadales bacterium]
MVNKPANVRNALKLFYALPILFVLGICGYLGWNHATHQTLPVRNISTQPFATVPIKGLAASLFTVGNQMHASGNDLFIEFRDARSNLVDVGAVNLELELKMPNMVMHSIGKVLRTATPGEYRTTVEPQMAGDWRATLGFNGSHGNGETNFTLAVH